MFTPAPAVLLSVFLWAMSLTSVKAAGPRATCDELYRISTGDTCSTIYSWSGVTPSKLQSLNPGIQCNSLTPGQSICIASYTPVCTDDVTATGTSCVPIVAASNITIAEF
ncbi:carbohydrate-binding module family 50 protein [Auriscalpium vulgare]|uniref:Carbohydrate-binding module family 50 protein n=1 Tax=Auriscalpium vulgare TaxID=40419 RepID=A0ACB8R5U7_9AGAM|nr:carbohydrate-binding module family 50 protein [Auriscalpium vulgare]